MSLINLFRQGKETLCILILQSNQPIFSDEVVKYLLLQQLNKRKSKITAAIYAFCVLDYELRLLIGVRPGEEHLAEEEARTERDIFFEQMKKRRLLRQSDEAEVKVIPLASDADLLEQCMRMHMLAVDQKVVSKPEDFFWHSYQTYRGSYIWNFLDIAKPLSLLPDARGERRRRYVRAQHQGSRPDRPLP